MIDFGFWFGSNLEIIISIKKGKDREKLKIIIIFNLKGGKNIMVRREVSMLNYIIFLIFWIWMENDFG